MDRAEVFSILSTTPIPERRWGCGRGAGGREHITYLPNNLPPSILPLDVQSTSNREATTLQQPPPPTLPPRRRSLSNGRKNRRTVWGEGKEERWPRSSLFSLPLAATLNYMFSGEMARNPPGLLRPQPTLHPTTASTSHGRGRSCILQRQRRCSAAEGRGRDQTMQKGRRRRRRRRLRLCTRCNGTESSPMHWRQAPAHSRSRPRSPP